MTSGSVYLLFYYSIENSNILKMICVYSISTYEIDTIQVCMCRVYISY